MNEARAITTTIVKTGLECIGAKIGSSGSSSEYIWVN